ncbi:MAG TPA: ATP-binding protein [Chthoniobacteraceae bacterium]|jgi:nitrogen-specific signal transduction histidine kinase/CheY-like chemotaxis protein|nr:ATP-binding protein [Chthoniobacteraceae bacterium]
MRTLLLLTKQPSLAGAVQAVLDPLSFQFICKESVAEAEFLLSRGAIDGVILDVELTDTRAIRVIEELKSFAPLCPTIVYAGSKLSEWEEDAYLLGVEHVLAKPVRGKLLNALLARLFPAHEQSKAITAAVPVFADSNGGRPCVDQVRALEGLRRFSCVLTHSLDSAALLKQFLLLLREIVGVNRAIVFLRKPAGFLGDSPLAADDRWLRSACAIGVDQSVLQHFALSLGAGIGGHLHQQGRILRAGSAEATASREITKEFQLLGAQVAIPILDRESLLGVALLDERLTGERYANEELALIFHMLEEVGLAIRNAWLHDQVLSNHVMTADVLGHLGSGCMVVGSNLATLHANASAMRYFLHDRAGKTQLEFSDLPQVLGSMVFTVIKSGVGVPAFKYQFAHTPALHYRVAITPFRTQDQPANHSALLIIEDITEHERAQRLEIETSNLRLVRSMAEHLAHEIGNSLVPLSTHQQLLKDSANDPEFQESLSTALANGVKRISRLANQMVFLARDSQGALSEPVAIGDLLVEAFHEAHTFHPGKKLAQLSFTNKDTGQWRISGDHKALRHAFSEIMLNALQANPEDPNVIVKLEGIETAHPHLNVEVRDSGKGFSLETAERAPEPFFSTRSVGLGLGLTVSRRIIENHQGTIEIAPSQTGEPGMVRVSLPIQI